jgi:hypothetical protein
MCVAAVWQRFGDAVTAVPFAKHGLCESGAGKFKTKNPRGKKSDKTVPVNPRPLRLRAECPFSRRRVRDAVDHS